MLVVIVYFEDQSFFLQASKKNIINELQIKSLGILWMDIGLKIYIEDMLNLIERSIFKSWWVVLFTLFCYGLYEHSGSKKSNDYMQLYTQLLNLQSEFARQVKIQEDLHLQINSQSDPDWLELTLMKGLGLVPEKQTKVFFTNIDSWNQ